MLRSDVPVAATGGNVGIGMRLNGQLIVRELCCFVACLSIFLSSVRRLCFLTSGGGPTTRNVVEPFGCLSSELKNDRL